MGETSRASRPTLLVVGSVNYDLMFRHERLPQAGESVVGAVFYESPGGKGANQAVAAARSAKRAGLDLRVVFAGAIGDDAFGRIQRGVLESEGIDTTHLVVVPGSATGTSAVWVEETTGQNRILSAPGANLALLPEVVAGVPVEDADLVLMPNEIPGATIAAVARRASIARVPLVWNPAPFPAGSVAPFDLAQAALVTPNEVEAAGLLSRGFDAASRDQTAAAARELARDTGSLVAITRGAHGALAVLGEQVIEEPAPSVQAIDTTGAGDAWNGALAAALLGDLPLDWHAPQKLARALAAAVAYASESVCRPGTQSSYPGA